jgi:hypothetical protein
MHFDGGPDCFICKRIESEDSSLLPSENQKTSSARNNEYNIFFGLITFGWQKSSTPGGQLREASVKMSRKPRPSATSTRQT